MNIINILTMMSIAFADDCKDTASDCNAVAWSDACARNAGVASGCAATCADRARNPDDQTVQNCAWWLAYGVALDGPVDPNCKDDPDTNCAAIAWSSGCQDDASISSKCPVSCSKNATDKDQNKLTCAEWKTHGDNKYGDCADTAGYDCSPYYSYDCTTNLEVATNCPVTCVQRTSWLTYTCDDYKSGNIPTIGPSSESTKTTTTTKHTTTTTKHTDGPGPAPEVPAVPIFTLPDFGYITITDLTTAKNKYDAPVSATRRRSMESRKHTYKPSLRGKIPKRR